MNRLLEQTLIPPASLFQSLYWITERNLNVLIVFTLSCAYWKLWLLGCGIVILYQPLFDIPVNILPYKDRNMCILIEILVLLEFHQYHDIVSLKINNFLCDFIRFLILYQPNLWMNSNGNNIQSGILPGIQHYPNTNFTILRDVYLESNKYFGIAKQWYLRRCVPIGVVDYLQHTLIIFLWWQIVKISFY